MIEPERLITDCQPPVIFQPGLLSRRGLYGAARGIVNPVVVVDRMGEGEPGFESLMFHEGLHVHERHALAGVLVLLGGCAAFALGLGLEAWGLLGTSLLTPAAFAWWRREQEVRADAFALRGAGARDFMAFVLMHPHPEGRWGRWCYGETPAKRFNRAVARAARYGWKVPL